MQNDNLTTIKVNNRKFLTHILLSSSKDPMLIPVLEIDKLKPPLLSKEFKSIPLLACEKEDVLTSDPPFVKIMICPWRGKSPMAPKGPV